MELKVGDRIKALDFAGRDDCYMIGVITRFDGELIYCKGETACFSGVTRDADNFVTTREGNHFMDKHFPGRITLIA